MPATKAKSRTKSNESRFDAAYYDRYYQSPRTRVHDAAKVGALATGVTGLLQWWEAPLATVLDVGAGVGHWGAWFRANMPKVKVRSTELSAHACERYGHEQRDIATWRARERFEILLAGAENLLHRLCQRLFVGSQRPAQRLAAQALMQFAHHPPRKPSLHFEPCVRIRTG